MPAATYQDESQRHWTESRKTPARNPPTSALERRPYGAQCASVCQDEGDGHGVPLEVLEMARDALGDLEDIDRLDPPDELEPEHTQ